MDSSPPLGFGYLQGASLLNPSLADCVKLCAQRQRERPMSAAMVKEVAVTVE